MKYLIGAIVGIILLVGGLFAYDPGMKMYNSAGQITGRAVKIWVDTITVTSASQSIDISSAGFTRILSANAQPELNTSTAASMPFASIKSYTTSSLVVNFLQSNTTTVGILGVNVIGIQALQAFSGTRVHIQVFGY